MYRYNNIRLRNTFTGSFFTKDIFMRSKCSRYEVAIYITIIKIIIINQSFLIIFTVS